jgi:hypothetical protein
MNTNTLLGNPIKRIFLKSDTTTRTWQAGCFNNDTLKDVYFMSPTVNDTVNVPTLNTIFTAA